MLQCFDVNLPTGIRLSCRAVRTAGAPKVVFLHGFPEAAFVWDELMQALQGEADCVAPNLRGFERSSSPTETEAYRAKHVVGDVAGLIDALGGDVDLLVAHDWGGALAWNLAAQSPARVKRLMILNSPHPATFLRELKNNPAQKAASAYMNFLCRPDAEALLAADGHRRLFGFLTRQPDGSEAAPAWLDDATRAHYAEVWGMGLTGGLNYYRSSPLRPAVPGDDAITRVEFPDAAVTVNVPTTVLWGERDAALLPALLDGLERWVPKLQVQRLPQASHWLVHEVPELVLAEVQRALRQPVR